MEKNISLMFDKFLYLYSKKEYSETINYLLSIRGIHTDSEISREEKAHYKYYIDILIILCKILNNTDKYQNSIYRQDLYNLTDNIRLFENKNNISDSNLVISVLFYSCAYICLTYDPIKDDLFKNDMLLLDCINKIKDYANIYGSLDLRGAIDQWYLFIKDWKDADEKVRNMIKTNLEMNKKGFLNSFHIDNLKGIYIYG